MRLSRVSIHAPARGATQNGRFFNGTVMFQSTHLRGVRPCSDRTIPKEYTCFNPRTCEGCDQLARCVRIERYCFNPRTCEGCDLPGCNFNITVAKFQSTHLRGVRLGLRGSQQLSGDVSIHAPARGATCARATLCNSIRCFNPRTCEGCDFRGVI